MRTGGERITTGTWNWGDRASTYLGPKQKIHVHCTMLLNHPHPRSPSPLLFLQIASSIRSMETIWFSNVQEGQMFRAATTKSRCMDTLKWICWRFLRQCWNVKVPSYALIRAYVTCMVNVFFHINHVSHTLFIN